MNLKKMNTIVWSAIPAVLVTAITLFILMNSWIGQATEKREAGVELTALGSDLLYNNDYAIKTMREFAVGLDASVLNKYLALVNDHSFLEGKLDEMQKYDLLASERTQISAIRGMLGKLEEIESEAVAAYRDGDTDRAVSIIQSADYSRADMEFAAAIKKLMLDLSDRIGVEAGVLTDRGKVGLVLLGVFFVLSLGAFSLIVRWFSAKAHWYDNILDHIPMPLSVTDMNRHMTFLNKPGEDMLGVTRVNVMGRHCADIWKAGICKTPDCGLECLGRGQPSTSFSHAGMDFKVESAYLLDKNGRKIGHVEAVMDITEMLKRQKAEAELVRDIENICESVASASTQLSDGSQTLAQGAAEQAAAVEELSTSISMIMEKTDENAGRASKAAILADTIKGNAERGSRQMDEMMNAVKDINAASQSISKVIKVIDDIAFQTNILALNAAVEAARAGQHGKGFAVVAEEVRNLAAKSAEAAKDTGTLIQNSMEKADLGSRIAEETSSSLIEIVSGINESDLIVSEIASSLEEQSQGIAQINSGIDQVAQVVQQNSATAEESAAASSEMSGQSAMLQELISQFKMKDGQPSAVRAAPRAARELAPPKTGDYGKY